VVLRLQWPEVEDRWFVGLSLGRFFLFFFNHVFLVLKYKKLHAALAMSKTKPINNNHDPLHLFMGKIKHPESIGKVPLS